MSIATLFNQAPTSHVVSTVLSSSSLSILYPFRPYVCRKDHHHFLSPSRLSIPLCFPPGRHMIASPSRSRSSVAGSAGALLGLPGPILRDAGATAAVMAGAYFLIFTLDNLTERNLIEQNLSRKLVHILSGLLFLASWPIFSNATEARYFASLVPLVNCLRLVVYGLSLATDEGLIKSVTRQGNPQELLRGPLYYVLILIVCTLAFWRSPVGVISLAMMCGGDGKINTSTSPNDQFLTELFTGYLFLLGLVSIGIADIMGRRFGSVKLPYNQQKSWVGSISMFLFGSFVSFGMLYYYSALGYFHLDWIRTAERVALVSLVATLVESFPMSRMVDDNISVPLASMVTAFLSFGF